MLVYRPSWKRKLLGWSLILFGIAGLILPILNGTIPLLLGAFVMREQYAWTQRCLAWGDRKWPGQIGKLAGLEARMIQRCRNGTLWVKRKLRLA
jgi:hypothetical protein